MLETNVLYSELRVRDARASGLSQLALLVSSPGGDFTMVSADKRLTPEISGGGTVGLSDAGWQTWHDHGHDQQGNVTRARSSRL